MSIRVQAVNKFRAPLPEKVPGQHLWIMLSMFRVNPSADQFDLDLENMLTIEGPGCYWCEQPHAAEVAAQPCRG